MQQEVKFKFFSLEDVVILATIQIRAEQDSEVEGLKKELADKEAECIEHLTDKRPS